MKLLIDDFKKCKKKFKKKLKNPVKISLLTGESAACTFEKFKKEINVQGLEFDVIGVKNRFFGDKINVSGLITGEDMINAIRENGVKCAIIPSVMLREGSDEFLDGIKISDIKKQFLGVELHIIKDCYRFREILDIINSK